MALGPRFPEVLSAAAEGEEWAWAELYRDLAPGLLRFLASQGATDPDDCLGEVFLQVVRQLPQFVGDEPDLRTWVFRIARSRLIDAWRREQRRPQTVGVDPDQMPDGAVLGAPADEFALRRAAVDEILAQLTPDQRAVLVLRHLHQFSVAETAAILGKGEGAVRVLQHRALRSLRRTLGERAPASGEPAASSAAARARIDVRRLIHAAMQSF